MIAKSWCGGLQSSPGGHFYLALAALGACVAPLELITLSFIRLWGGESLGWVMLPSCVAVSL